jgi:hypothetical protein
MRATCDVHLNLPDLIILRISDEVRRSSLWNFPQPPVTSSDKGPNLSSSLYSIISPSLSAKRQFCNTLTHQNSVRISCSPHRSFLLRPPTVWDFNGGKDYDCDFLGNDAVFSCRWIGLPTLRGAFYPEYTKNRTLSKR